MATNISVISFSNPNKVAMAYGDCAIMRNLKPKFQNYEYKLRVLKVSADNLTVEAIYSPGFTGTYTTRTEDIFTDPDIDDNDIIIKATSKSADVNYNAGYVLSTALIPGGSEWWGNTGSASEPMGTDIFTIELLKGKIDSLVADFSSASYNQFSPVVTIKNNGKTTEAANFATIAQARAKPEVEIMPAAEGIQGGQILLTYGPGQGKIMVYVLEDADTDGARYYGATGGGSDLAPWKNGKPMKLKSWFLHTPEVNTLVYTTDEVTAVEQLTVYPATIDETKEVLVRVKVKNPWPGYYPYLLAYPWTYSFWFAQNSVTTDKATTDWADIRVMKGTAEKMTMNFTTGDSSHQWAPRVIAESGNKTLELKYRTYVDAFADRFAPLPFSGDNTTKYERIVSSIEPSTTALYFSKTRKEVKLKITTTSSSNDYKRFGLSLSKSFRYITVTGPIDIKDEPNACEFTFSTYYDTLASETFHVKTIDGKMKTPDITIGFTPDKIINYDLNGGVDMISTYKTKDTIGVGEEYTIPTCDLFPPVGKSFSHWNTSKDDKGTKYQADQKVTFDTPDPITLYPIWKDFVVTPGKGKVLLYLLTDNKGASMRYPYNCVVSAVVPWKGDKPLYPVKYHEPKANNTNDAYILCSVDGKKETLPAASTTPLTITDPDKEVIIRAAGTGFRGSSYIPRNICSQVYGVRFNGTQEYLTKEDTKLKVLIEVIDGTVDRLTASFASLAGYNNWTPHVVMVGDTKTKEVKYDNMALARGDLYRELPLSGATITKPDIDTKFSFEPASGVLFTRDVKSMKLKIVSTSSGNDYKVFNFRTGGLPTGIATNNALTAIPDEPGSCYITYNFSGNLDTFGSGTFQIYTNINSVRANDMEIPYGASNKIVISFDKNGGEGTMPDKEYDAKLPVTLPDSTFTPPAGKVFDYWTDKPDGIIAYHPDVPAVFPDGGTKTLYAKYRDAKAGTGKGAISITITNPDKLTFHHANTTVLNMLKLWVGDKYLYIKSVYDPNASTKLLTGTDTYLVMSLDEKYKSVAHASIPRLKAKPTADTIEAGEVIVRMGATSCYQTNAFAYSSWFAAVEGNVWWSGSGALNTQPQNFVLDVIEGSVDRVSVNFATRNYKDFTNLAEIRSGGLKKTYRFENWEQSRLVGDYNLPFIGQKVPEVKDITPTMKIEPDVIQLGAITKAGEYVTAKLITNSAVNSPLQYFYMNDNKIEFPGLDMTKLTFTYAATADPKVYELRFGLVNFQGDNNSLMDTKSKLTTPQMKIETNEITLKVNPMHRFKFLPTYGSGTMEDVIVPVGDYKLPEVKFTPSNLPYYRNGWYYKSKIVGWSKIQQVWDNRNVRWKTQPSGTDLLQVGDTITTTAPGETTLYMVADIAPMDFEPYRPATPDIEVVEGSTFTIEVGGYGLYTLNYEVSDPNVVIYQSLNKYVNTFKAGAVDKDTKATIKFWWSIATLPGLEGKSYTYNVTVKAKVGYLKIEGDGGVIDTKAMGYVEDKGIPVDSEKGITLPEPIFTKLPDGKIFKIYSYYQGNQAAHNHIKPGANYKVENGMTRSLWCIYEDIPKPDKPADQTVEVEEGKSVEITLQELQDPMVYEFKAAKGTVAFKKDSKNILVYTAPAVDADESTTIEVKVNHRTVLSDPGIITVNIKNIVTTATVTFDANTGSGDMPAQTPEAGSYTIPASSFTPPTGYEFDKWNTKSDGSGTEYTVGQKVDLKVGQTLALFAVWKKLPAEKPATPVLVSPTGDIEVESGKTIDITVKVTPANIDVESAFPQGKGNLKLKTGSDTTGEYTYTYTAHTVTQDEVVNLTYKAVNTTENVESDVLTVPVTVKAPVQFEIEIVTQPDYIYSEATGNIVIKEIPDATITLEPATVKHRVLNATNIEVTAPKVDKDSSITVNVVATKNGITKKKELTIPIKVKPAEVKFATLYLVPNGAAGKMQEIKVEVGKEFTVPDNMFTPPDGKQFKTWAEFGDGTTPHPVGSKVTFTAEGMPMWFAIWEDAAPKPDPEKPPVEPEKPEEKKYHTVKFNGNTATGNMPDVKVELGVEFTIPNEGYEDPADKKFKHWSTELDGKTIINPGDKVTFKSEGTTTYYAIWAEIPKVLELIILDPVVETEVGKPVAIRYTVNGEATLSVGVPVGKGQAEVKDGEIIFTSSESYLTTETVLLSVKAALGAQVKEAPAKVKVVVPETKYRTIKFIPGEGTGAMPDVQWDISKAYHLPRSTFTPPKDKVFEAWSESGKGDILLYPSETASFDTEGETTYIAIYKEVTKPDPDQPDPKPDPEPEKPKELFIRVLGEPYEVERGKALVINIEYTEGALVTSSLIQKGTLVVNKTNVIYTAPEGITKEEVVVCRLAASLDGQFKTVDFQIKVTVPESPDKPEPIPPIEPEPEKPEPEKQPDANGNVTFHPNGGKGKEIKYTLVVDEKLPLVYYEPPEGYRFIGWGENVEGTLNFRLPQSVFKDMGTGTTITLYAVYVKDEISINKLIPELYMDALPEFTKRWRVPSEYELIDKRQ